MPYSFLAASPRGRNSNRRTDALRAWRKNTWKFRTTIRNGPACKICGQPFTESNQRTFDHIVPKAGKKGISNAALVHPDNFRVMCARCNILRGVARHCLGLMACAVAVAEDVKRYPLGGKSPRVAANGVPRAAGRIINRWLSPEPPKRTWSGSSKGSRSRKRARRRHAGRVAKKAARIALIGLLVAKSEIPERLAA